MNFFNNTEKTGLSGNFLKIIALITMTVDHVGLELFDNMLIMRIIGRIAFPIFAYMIAEGCTYTRNRRKHLLTIALLAFLCQAVYFVAMNSLYQCILVTFSLSVALIYSIDNAIKNKTFISVIVCVLTVSLVAYTALVLPVTLSKTDYGIDYGIFGVLLPVLVYFARTKEMKLAAFTVGLSLVCYDFGGIQWYSLLTVPLIALYNGKRGRLKLKNLFYIYYPLHLVIIHFIGVLL